MVVFSTSAANIIQMRWPPDGRSREWRRHLSTLHSWARPTESVNGVRLILKGAGEIDQRGAFRWIQAQRFAAEAESLRGMPRRLRPNFSRREDERDGFVAAGGEDGGGFAGGGNQFDARSGFRLTQQFCSSPERSVSPPTIATRC